jgi:ribosomal subunit interface protein
MTMPTINFRLNDVSNAEELQVLVERKFAAFEKYWNETAEALCDVEFAKVAPQQNGQVHQVQANLTVNGTLFHAEATLESFEQAIDEVRDQLDKELRRSKDKADTLEKKQGREMKEQLLG